MNNWISSSFDMFLKKVSEDDIKTKTKLIKNRIIIQREKNVLHT